MKKARQVQNQTLGGRNGIYMQDPAARLKMQEARCLTKYEASKRSYYLAVPGPIEFNGYQNNFLPQEINHGRQESMPDAWN